VVGREGVLVDLGGERRLRKKGGRCEEQQLGWKHDNHGGLGRTGGVNSDYRDGMTWGIFADRDGGEAGTRQGNGSVVVFALVGGRRSACLRSARQGSGSLDVALAVMVHLSALYDPYNRDSAATEERYLRSVVAAVDK